MEQARPVPEAGRAHFNIRITKPDGASRDVECEADIKPARLALDEPFPQETR